MIVDACINGSTTILGPGLLIVVLRSHADKPCPVVLRTSDRPVAAT